MVQAAEMVAGHARLDISRVDRLYLNGYVPGLQTPGGVIYFLHQVRGKPFASPALFEKIGGAFRAQMRAWATERDIPVIRCTGCVSSGADYTRPPVSRSWNGLPLT